MAPSLFICPYRWFSGPPRLRAGHVAAYLTFQSRQVIALHAPLKSYQPPAREPILTIPGAFTISWLMFRVVDLFS